MPDDEGGTKGARTRERIRTAALASFRENGYEATTIRGIADTLGMSVGATNYHFASKNQLVQELYRDVQESHRDAAAPALATETRLIERLRIVFSSGLDQLGPYHAHAGEFLAAAASPRSPINPLSKESAASLAIVEDLFRSAVAGATGVRLPDEIRRLLPRALVLGHLLLALSWVYDATPGQRRTRFLLDRGLNLLGTVLPLARLPLLRGPVTEALSLLGDLRG
ncbi:TetR/AcrR family transcriptional regulator [Microbacterium sp. T2.11-28]|uniref:TetR/AcrR family transcriptional regulator n=1 Tax=Microbacterium sp. T2.11-28 TaxID=3041169 RepID=UPI0024775A20|nr:TetR/AcrR family transcriptional regulator [Microbacterium sp. T2.11-28]CAI9393922.1 HTH-type transcriptional regulator BetI [Microbacterium sp. T2.11-28]